MRTPHPSENMIDCAYKKDTMICITHKPEWEQGIKSHPTTFARHMSHSRSCMPSWIRRIGNNSGAELEGRRKHVHTIELQIFPKWKFSFSTLTKYYLWWPCLCKSVPLNFPAFVLGISDAFLGPPASLYSEFSRSALVRIHSMPVSLPLFQSQQRRRQKHSQLRWFHQIFLKFEIKASLRIAFLQIWVPSPWTFV